MIQLGPADQTRSFLARVLCLSGAGKIIIVTLGHNFQVICIIFYSKYMETYVHAHVFMFLCQCEFLANSKNFQCQTCYLRQDLIVALTIDVGQHRQAKGGYVPLIDEFRMETIGPVQATGGIQVPFPFACRRERGGTLYVPWCCSHVGMVDSCVSIDILGPENVLLRAAY